MVLFTALPIKKYFFIFIGFTSLVHSAVEFSWSENCQGIIRNEEGDISVHQFDEKGRYIRCLDHQGETNFLYGDTEYPQSIYLPNCSTLHYRYNHKDELIRIYSENAPHAVDYNFFYEGSKVEQVDELSQTEGYTIRDEKGQIIEEKLLNGLLLRFTYEKNQKRVEIDGIATYVISYEEGKPTKIVKEGEGSSFEFFIRDTNIDDKIISMDQRGNILEYQRDGENYSYSYDEKDQVIQEMGPFSYQYEYDKHYNRLTLHEEVDQIEQFDALGRLIMLQRGDLKIEMKFDASGRRLEKKIFKIKSEKEELIENRLYLYEGKNEIGSVVNGHLVDFRLLEGGRGAEMGASILIEIESIPYYPFHDLYGNIVGLQDLDGERVETINFSAFKEEVCTGKIHSPWRYRSKRYDQEIDYTFFGRRFYDGNRGIFIGKDPTGYDISSNLTQYVGNNPLKFCDLYGLETKVGLQSIISREIIAQALVFAGIHLPIPAEYGYRLRAYGSKLLGFDDVLEFEPNEIFEVGENGRCGNDAIIYVNGVNTARNQAEYIALRMASLYNHKVTCIFNASEGLGRDVVEAFLEKFMSFESPPVLLLKQKILEEAEDPERKIYIFCHSRGAAITYNAVFNLPEEIKNRIHIYAFGPAKLLPRELAAKVINYRSVRDPIPFLDPRPYIELPQWDACDIVELGSEEAPLFDHSFLGVTYQGQFNAIAEEILALYPVKECIERELS